MGRKFSPRGQTNVHFPHNIHFSSSLANLSYCACWYNDLIFRMLKEVNCCALHVAVQAPQFMQRLNEGARFSSWCNLSKSHSSKLTALDFAMEYPKLIIFFYILMKIRCLFFWLSKKPFVMFHTACHFVDAADFVQILLADLAECARTLAVIIGA